MNIGDRLFILHISHRHGDNLDAFTTEEGAWDALDAYIQEWWVADGPIDEPMPDNKDDRIRLYFEDSDETYQLEERVLNP